MILVEKIVPVARERLVAVKNDALLTEAARFLDGGHINLVVVCDSGGATDGRLIIARHGTKRDADMLKNFIVLLPLPLEPCCSGSKAQLPDTLQNLPKCRLGSTAHGSICIQEG